MVRGKTKATTEVKLIIVKVCVWWVRRESEPHHAATAAAGYTN
jgi:hypothetical protein